MSSLKSHTGKTRLRPAMSDLFWSYMYCLVDCTLRHIQIREDLFEEMLQEPDEIAAKRMHCRELLRAYQQAFRMDYINTSHLNFIGGSKAIEVAVQQTKSSRVPLPVSRVKDALESDKGPASERSVKSRAILGRHANGVVADHVCNFMLGIRAASDVEKIVPSGNTGGSSWGISSIFGGGDNRVSVKENTASKPHPEPVHSVQSFSTIHLREPPAVLRPSESCSETEAVEITVTKLLLKSYYDIVRKNVEDLVPKAIMHFLVNNTKRELHNVFMEKLYREDLFEEMLQEPDEIATKRKHCRELLRAYQQAFRELDELPLEAETVEIGYSLPEITGLPKIRGLPISSLYSTSSFGDIV